MNTAQQNGDLESGQSCVGNAGGLSARHWYIARMRRCNTEKAVAARLDKMGYQTYVAIRPEVRQWANGRRATIDSVVIPSTVFVKCTETQRRTIVSLPFISHFMTDRAGYAPEGCPRPIAKVSDSEIDKLRFMLGVSDTPVGFVDHYVRGQAVRIIRGPLAGLEGIVIDGSCSSNSGRQFSDACHNQNAPTTRIYINIDFLGATHIQISPIDLEVIR